MEPRRRAAAILVAVGGAVLLVFGIALDASQASLESQCSAAGPSLLGLPGGPSSSACSHANLLSGIGLALLIVGVVLLVAAAVIALHRPRL